MGNRSVVVRCAGALLLTCGVLAGCKGGGDGSGGTASGTALQLAEAVSVVDASSASTQTSLSKALGIKATPPGAGSGADWFADVTHTFVAERSAESFDTVNEILCSLAQTQYDEKLNDGPYTALIDFNQCSKERDSASGEGQNTQDESSGATRTSYETWTIKSARTEGEPHVVSAWIHMTGDEFAPDALICAKATIHESVSADNPYGIFTIHFAEHPKGSSCSATPMVKGILQAERDSTTGKVLLKFVADGGFADGGTTASFSEQAVLDRAADGQSGTGSMATRNNWGSFAEAFQFDIAFNESYFLRDKEGTQVCLNRKDFVETAWRYGLYDTNGKRVVRNSGFPIRYTAGGKDYDGWVGFWGLWTPDNVTINDGETVYKQTFGEDGGSETPYTAIRAGGKLKKHTRYATTLAAIRNVPLNWFDTTAGTDYRVRWNGTSFVKFAALQQGDWVWASIVESALDLAALPFGELNFWSQGLGGSVRVPLEGCVQDVDTNTYVCNAPADATDVIFYTEDLVYPDDTVPEALRCYDNCPRPSDGSGNVDFYDSDYSPGATGHTYRFDTEAMVLFQADAAVLQTAAASGQNQWGVHTGPLFAPTTANLAALQCEWDPARLCGWKAWSVLSEYYTWETGINPWNQLSLLQDAAGTVLRFDAPLQVEYRHTQTDTAAPDAKYNGTTFFLEYNGFGELHGIPNHCIDMDTGAPTSCKREGEAKIRWIPEFLIPEGSTVTSGGVTYYAKPLEKEQVMKQAETAICAGAGLATTSYTLPNITLWEDPAIGDEPSVSGAPAVIGGVLQ